MDKIMINGLRVFAHHGVNPEEKQNGQPYELDITLFLDLSLAGKTDRLTDTVNYSSVVKSAVAVMQSQTDNLIERAATRVADAILNEYPVMSVTVVLKKPYAPIKEIFDFVGVEITRKREDML